MCMRKKKNVCKRSFIFFSTTMWNSDRMYIRLNVVVQSCSNSQILNKGTGKGEPVHLYRIWSRTNELEMLLYFAINRGKAENTWYNLYGYWFWVYGIQHQLRLVFNVYIFNFYLIHSFIQVQSLLSSKKIEKQKLTKSFLYKSMTTKLIVNKTAKKIPQKYRNSGYRV